MTSRARQDRARQVAVPDGWRYRLKPKYGVTPTVWTYCEGPLVLFCLEEYEVEPFFLESALLSEAEAEREEWQDIETAPKDGTRVMLARSYSDGTWYFDIAYWHAPEKPGITGWYGANHLASGDYWRHLPAPPPRSRRAGKQEPAP